MIREKINSINFKIIGFLLILGAFLFYISYHLYSYYQNNYLKEMADNYINENSINLVETEVTTKKATKQKE